MMLAYNITKLKYTKNLEEHHFIDIDCHQPSIYPTYHITLTLTYKI